MEEQLFEMLAADFDSSDSHTRYAELEPEFTPDTEKEYA